jgi:hypothetical protein
MNVDLADKNVLLFLFVLFQEVRVKHTLKRCFLLLTKFMKTYCFLSTFKDCKKCEYDLQFFIIFKIKG